MDPRRNPYSPGAGSPPPELAGRDALIEDAAVALDRIKAGRHPQSLILVGLRGVGKTVLLDRIRTDAETRGIQAIRLETPEDRSLPALLAPGLRAALLRLRTRAGLSDKLKRAFAVLRSWIGAVRISYGDVEVSVDVDPEPGSADSGDIEHDLPELFTALGEAAADRDTAFVMFIDELQYVSEKEFAALITALHRTSQRSLPIAMVGAGLPQIIGKAGRAKSYAERLFKFPQIGPLDKDDAINALARPAAREDVAYDNAALDAIIDATKGYPYFLQEWGKHAWAAADASPIALGDAEAATVNALAELDASFFRVRFDRLTPEEKRYLRAMAELGDGPHRSGDIAEKRGRKTQSLGPVRSSLIEKGMIYSPAHGDTAFTVPLFAGFMKRTMPSLQQ
ncbi:MAG: ATP-binding protein [Alphaproteobacteria bacterium]|nr:ATP-binding protein [Alphaproteobacteria bacterium]